MTPAARATALLLAALGGLFAAAATAGWHVWGSWLRRREDRRARLPRHLKPVRHRAEPRHERLVWTVSLAIRFYRWAVSVVVRFYRWEDGGPKTAVMFGALVLAFSVLMGADA